MTDFGLVRDGDLEIIATPLDVLGVNYYSRHVVAAPSDEQAGEPYWRAPSCWPGSEDVRFVTRGLPVTEMDWEVDAAGLVEMLQRVHREYPAIPLYITENGAAFDDEVGRRQGRRPRPAWRTSTPTCGPAMRRSRPGCRCAVTSRGR